MSNIDATIQTLFGKLAERKTKVEDLKAQGSKSWQTNGTFRLIGATSTTNLQTASVEVIEEVATHISTLSLARTAASTKLGRAFDAKVQGFTVDQWFDDLKKRLATIEIREEEAKLAKLETQLNQLLSPDERRRIEVELLAKELS